MASDTIRHRASVGVVVAVLAAAPAAAQQASEPGAIEDVVVTAQRREQRAQDVGITLDTYSGEQLREAGIVSVPDVVKLAPGVSTAGSFAGQSTTFSIRGVTQQDFSPQAEPPVAVYIDDTYVAANNISGLDLLDVDQVEILKGPQGTLFGRNATGGLVNILSRRPTADFSANASLTYGSYDDLRTEAAVGGPIADGLEGRIAYLHQSNAGWVRNTDPTGSSLGGRDANAGRAQLAWQPIDTLNLLATGYAADTRQSWGPYFATSTRAVVRNGVPDDITVGAPVPLGYPSSNIDGLEVDANDALSHGGRNRIGGGTLHADWDIAGGTLTSITDYKVVNYRLLLDDDAGPPSFLDTNTQARVENHSEEARYFRDFGGVANLTAGFYYLHINATSADLQRLFGLGGVQVNSPLRLLTDSYSGFAQGEYQVLETIRLIAGFRATREDKDFRYQADIQTLAGLPIETARTYRGKRGDWLFSAKAQIEYRPEKGLLFYAGYNRGTKAGSFNAPFAGGAIPSDAQIPYRPEELDAYETGAKATLIDGTLVADGAFFHYDYSDYQSFQFINFSSLVTNNPARVDGAEAQLTYEPLPGLRLTGSATWLDSIVKAVNVTNGLAAVTLDRRAPFTSKWKAVAGASYEWPLGPGMLAVEADTEYDSDSYFSVTNFTSTRVSPHALLNARIAWRPEDSHWEVALTGRNLTDRRYKTVGFDITGFGGFTQVGIGQPLWLDGSVSYTF